MSRILRMNRLLIPKLSGKKEPPSVLLEILLFTGFSAEMNLLRIAKALGQKDHAILDEVAERNLKLARLRRGIDEEVAKEVPMQNVGRRTARKLSMISEIALFYEKFGDQTVELAKTCREIIRQPKTGATSGIKKLIEHATYMADSVASGFVYDEVIWVKAAIEQSRAAEALSARISRDLGDRADISQGSSNVQPLNLIIQTNEIITGGRLMAGRVLDFLESSAF